MLTVAPAHYRHAEHLREHVETYLSKWLSCAGDGRVQTGCGLCFLQKWAPLRYASTTALLGAMYAHRYPRSHLANATAVWAERQLAYVLGDNGLGLSFMIGYAGEAGGLRFPRRPHHRAASCLPRSIQPWCNLSDACAAEASPYTVFGAVVGGPDASDCWNDDRANWERNEVALDYNAPYPGLLAWALGARAKRAAADRAADELANDEAANDEAANVELASVAVNFDDWAASLRFTQPPGDSSPIPRRLPFADICPAGPPSDLEPACPHWHSPCLPDPPNMPPSPPSPPWDPPPPSTPPTPPPSPPAPPGAPPGLPPPSGPPPPSPAPPLGPCPWLLDGISLSELEPPLDCVDVWSLGECHSELA